MLHRVNCGVKISRSAPVLRARGESVTLAALQHYYRSDRAIAGRVRAALNRLHRSNKFPGSAAVWAGTVNAFLSRAGA